MSRAVSERAARHRWHGAEAGIEGDQIDPLGDSLVCGVVLLIPQHPPAPQPVVDDDVRGPAREHEPGGHHERRAAPTPAPGRRADCARGSRLAGPGRCTGAATRPGTSLMALAEAPHSC